MLSLDIYYGGGLLIMNPTADIQVAQAMVLRRMNWNLPLILYLILPPSHVSQLTPGLIKINIKINKFIHFLIRIIMIMVVRDRRM